MLNGDSVWDTRKQCPKWKFRNVGIFLKAKQECTVRKIEKLSGYIYIYIDNC
jgi:hypothetical protein